tara:strand:+ start:1647 stop:2102 length:456 start_codon:yes stop_codon:yes gene_type:complete
MKNSIEEIDKILIESNNSIKEEINGISYLETLKFNIIDKAKDLDENYLKNLKLFFETDRKFNKEIILNEKKIIYNIEYYEKTITNIKHKITDNSLFIVLEGLKSIEIQDITDQKKSIYSNLSKNMGVVITENTTVTTKIAANSLILSILNK